MEDKLGIPIDGKHDKYPGSLKYPKRLKYLGKTEVPRKCTIRSSLSLFGHNLHSPVTM